MDQISQSQIDQITFLVLKIAVSLTYFLIKDVFEKPTNIHFQLSDFCGEDNANIPGHNLAQPKVADASACQKNCENNPKCKFYTFQKSKKICWLKTGRADVKWGNTDVVSGTKFCGNLSH